jgi:DNA-directed RNA polymerase specialized sigma24 family protein
MTQMRDRRPVEREVWLSHIRVMDFLAIIRHIGPPSRRRANGDLKDDDLFSEWLVVLRNYFRLRGIYDDDAQHDAATTTLERSAAKLAEGVEINGPFVWGIARNVAREEIRKQVKQSRREIPISDLRGSGDSGPDFDPPSPDGGLGSSSRARELLGMVPKKHLRMLYLQYCEGLGPTEIGNLLGMNPNTVTVTTRRAIQKLKVRISQRPPGVRRADGRKEVSEWS